MATRTKAKTQGKKLKFELSRGSAAGIGVVVFCLFFWMFLLGLWAGQSLEFPDAEPALSAGSGEKIQLGPLVITADKKALKKFEK